MFYLRSSFPENPKIANPKKKSSFPTIIIFQNIIAHPVVCKTKKRKNIKQTIPISLRVSPAINRFYRYCFFCTRRCSVNPPRRLFVNSLDRCKFNSRVDQWVDRGVRAAAASVSFCT